MKKDHYLILRKGDLETLFFTIIPLTSEAAYTSGMYVPTERVLELYSKDKREELTPVEKLDSGLNPIIEKGKKTYERRMTNPPLIFSLQKNEITWFLENMCVNPEVGFAIIKEIDDAMTQEMLNQE